MSHRSGRTISGLCLAAMLASLSARAQTVSDIVSQTELRVCADPHNLPFSNQQSEGYENKIAELVASELHEKLSYTWFPDSQGFVRGTLMKNRCDVIIGTVAGVESMSTTDSYLHTGYMMVTRAADNITTASVGDWHIAGRRFGLIAATPPTNLIIEHNLMDQTAIYQLMVDTRVDQPAHAMITDVAAGRVDVGLLWGPIAGYYAKHDHLPLRLTFLSPETSKVRLDYHIAMGVRPADVAFRRRLNGIVAKDGPQITKILQDFGVPLLDEQNRPIPAGPVRPTGWIVLASFCAAATTLAAVPEPDSYRMDHYRGPVPETLRGAHVLHTVELARFIAAAHPVVIDVLPAPPVPRDSRPGLPRLPIPQTGLPGTIWLPDVGRGALSPQTEAWFRAHLAEAMRGSLDMPVVFYCLSQCWMSWNAARRAVSYGYRQVVWYPDGADGWLAAGLPGTVLKAVLF